MTTGIVLNESKHPGAFMVSEAPGRLSRDALTVSQSQTLITGQVIGLALKGSGSFAAAAGVAGSGNTGNGTMSAPNAPAGAQAGNYSVEYTAALRFNVYDPSGKLVGEGVNGTAFNNQIGFTMTAGGTAFAAGDTFSVTVTETDPTDAGQVEALNLSGTDGSQTPAGIMWDNVTTASGQTVLATVIRRNAEVRGVDLTYPSGATTTQIATINTQLASLGIIVR